VLLFAITIEFSELKTAVFCYSEVFWILDACSLLVVKIILWFVGKFGGLISEFFVITVWSTLSSKKMLRNLLVSYTGVTCSQDCIPLDPPTCTAGNIAVRLIMLELAYSSLSRGEIPRLLSLLFSRLLFLDGSLCRLGGNSFWEGNYIFFLKVFEWSLNVGSFCLRSLKECDILRLRMSALV